MKGFPMNFNSILSSSGQYLSGIADISDILRGFLPEQLEQLPEALNNLLHQTAAMVPVSLDYSSVFKFILIFGVLILGFGVLSRLIFGMRSELNHAMSASVGILFVYILTTVVYTFQPAFLTKLLSPLPFVTYVNDYLFIYPFHGSPFSGVCAQILSLIILSFLVNCMDALLPEGEHVVSWYLVRFLIVVLSMLLHLAANWAFSKYLPNFIVTYAPVVLLILLISLLALGLVKLVLGIFLTVVNPILGGIYAFFFSSLIGRQLTKSVLSALILCAVFYALDHFNYLIICITAAALPTYLPLLAALLVIWYLIGHTL